MTRTTNIYAMATVEVKSMAKHLLFFRLVNEYNKRFGNALKGNLRSIIYTIYTRRERARIFQFNIYAHAWPRTMEHAHSSLTNHSFDIIQKQRNATANETREPFRTFVAVRIQNKRRAHQIYLNNGNYSQGHLKAAAFIPSNVLQFAILWC